jgi:tetratricopeptide (TPR) repeat protein
MLAIPSPRCLSLRHFALRRPSLTVPAQCMSCAVLLLAFTYRPLAAQAVPGSGDVWAGTSDLRLRQLEEVADQMYQRDSTTERVIQRPQQTCILQPYPGMSNTVSVRSLEVPDKVQNEYQRACTALQFQKFADAEKHLRKALQLHSADALGWVMLGRIMQVTERLEEGTKACTEAVVHDPSYWPAQICLAEIDAREQRWSNSLEESNRAVSLNQESKRFAYYISALALFNLNKVSDAESRALEAERLDRDHLLPPLQLLLARIKEFKGDLQAAKTELRDCLKYGKNSPAGNMAKQELARLGSGPN